MAQKKLSSTKRAPRRTGSRADTALGENGAREILWRLDRLERQVKTLSELVRDHAEDADRLVKIVGEDHEMLRRRLLSEHQETIRRRRHLRSEASRNILGKARLVE